MKSSIRSIRLVVALALALSVVDSATASAAPAEISITSHAARLQWAHSDGGWKLTAAAALDSNGHAIPIGEPSGQYRILYSATEPDRTPIPFTLAGRDDVFPEPVYTYPVPRWAKATIPAALNLAGEERISRSTNT